MTDDDIERFLADEDRLLPSSGFEMSVMEAVHQEAVTPPPLQFPWRRALPGLVALLAAFVVAIWRWIYVLGTPRNALVDERLQILAAGTLAIIVTILSVLLPLRLIRGRL